MVLKETSAGFVIWVKIVGELVKAKGNIKLKGCPFHKYLRNFLFSQLGLVKP